MSLSLFSKGNFVGVDIGHKWIKLVQLEKKPTGFTVTRAVSTPTPPDTVKDSVVTDPDVVGIAIKNAMKEHKIGANKAIAGVSGGSVIVRTVQTPKMTELMLRKSIRYEAGRYVPSSIEDSFIEFEILGDADEGNMNVMIVAAPREVVQSRIQALSKAGLSTEIVDVEAFAMFRSLVESDESSILHQMTIALVDIGAHMTTVSVIQSGEFSMTRTIPQAGQTWTDALKNYFKLGDDDAEIGKAQLDLTPLSSEQVTDNQPLRVLQPHVDDLIREIRRSLNYYQSQQTESGSQAPVTHLMVSGGGAKLKGLGEYLAYKLGVQVVTTGVFDNPRFINGTTAETGQGLDFAVASGLAMRGTGKVA